MKKRSVFEFIILCCITFGIYWMIWLYKTKEEMKVLGAEIPTFFLFFVPFANVWWMWKYACGVELATKKAMSAPIAFILLLCLHVIGSAVILVKLNETAAG